MSQLMHDWTLSRLAIDWAKKTVWIVVSWRQREMHIIARGLLDLHVPCREEWGPSVSINSITGPERKDKNEWFLAIEMQSGDLITVLAEEIILPTSAAAQ
jgi:hypothetical protein